LSGEAPVSGGHSLYAVADQRLPPRQLQSRAEPHSQQAAAGL